VTNEENIVRYSATELDEMIRRGQTLTDWERVRNMTDEEIEASIDPDDEGEFDWSTLRAVNVVSGRGANVSVDEDTVDWFRVHAPNDFQDRINDVLRAYIAEQTREAS
jgi:uncharacterized protein (DUF4415 family)